MSKRSRRIKRQRRAREWRPVFPVGTRVALLQRDYSQGYTSPRYVVAGTVVSASRRRGTGVKFDDEAAPIAFVPCAGIAIADLYAEEQAIAIARRESELWHASKAERKLRDAPIVAQRFVAGEFDCSVCESRGTVYAGICEACGAE